MATFDAVIGNTAPPRSWFPFIALATSGFINPDETPVLSAAMTSVTNLRITLLSPMTSDATWRDVDTYTITTVQGRSVEVEAVAYPTANGTAAYIDLTVSRHTAGAPYIVTVSGATYVEEDSAAVYYGVDYPVAGVWGGV